MENKLKYISFEFDEVNKELLISRDNVTFCVPKRYIGSLQIFLNRIYRKGFYRKVKK